MKNLLNLSNHNLTPQQTEELSTLGYQVIELNATDKQAWGQLNPQDYKAVCDEILDKYQADAYHLAGFPAAVVYVTRTTNKPCYYAYSTRQSVEAVQEDGTVVKKNIFKHQGFYLY